MEVWVSRERRERCPGPQSPTRIARRAVSYVRNYCDADRLLLLGRVAALAVDRILKTTANARCALHATLLQRRGQPFVTLPHAPDCAVRHVRGAQHGRKLR